MKYFHRLVRKIKFYLTLPEMRMQWLFLVLIAAYAFLAVQYFPRDLRLPVIGVLVVMSLILFMVNLRLGRTGYEAKLERNQIQAVIANLQDGIVAYDPTFTVRIFNAAAEHIFGLKAEEVIGKTFTPDRIREPNLRMFIQIMFPALAPSVTQRGSSGEHTQEALLSFEDPKMELRVITVKIEDVSGKRPLGFFKAIRDETRERALIKSKTDFITVAAHQLRTPLAAINWIFQGFASGGFGELSDLQKETVSTGLKATTKLSKTVNDLLDASKIEEGRFGYSFERIDFVDFISKLLEAYMPVASEHSVKLYLENKLPKEFPQLTIDSAKMSLVIQNLLDNALKYNVENGEVTVTLEQLPDKPFVRVGVKDTGVGVPSEDLEKLFTKFFRAQNVVKFETDGSGLGLYIAKNVVERHGGEIVAESEINRGTTISFTVPTDEKLIPQRESAIDDLL